MTVKMQNLNLDKLNQIFGECSILMSKFVKKNHKGYLKENFFRLQEVRDLVAGTYTDKTNFTFVSIHARRTDYGYHLKALYNLTYVETSYFLNAMEYFTEKFQVTCGILKTTF
jgi:hypothetical protein